MKTKQPKEKAWFRHTVYSMLLVATVLSFVMGITLFEDGRLEWLIPTLVGCMFWMCCLVRRP